MPSTCYLAYLTANDSRTFHTDYFNFRHMTRFDPGVDCIQVYIAISLVKPWTFLDYQIIRAIINETKHCRWFQVKAMILKSNTGRDFSSAQKCLHLISRTAKDEDYIMIRSRSSRGPFMTSWYASYVSQFNKFNETGLVGSTINFKDHQARANKSNVAHIQTYVYMSQWKYFSRLLNDFPALSVTNHLDAILHGEIELSQRILSMGLRISALQKPDMIIDSSIQNSIPQNPVTTEVEFQKIPILHKRRYVEKRRFWLIAVQYSRLIFGIFKKKQDWILMKDMDEPKKMK